MPPMNPKQLKAFAGNKAKPPKKPPTPPSPDDEENKNPAADVEDDADPEAPAPEVAEDDGVENTGETAGDGDITTDEQLAQDVMGKVADGDVDEELVDLVGQAEPVEGSFPWVKDPDIWERAMKALDPDDIPQGVEPFVVLAHVYMAMGGHVEGLSDQEGEEPGGEGHEEPDADDTGAQPAPAAPPKKPVGKPPAMA